MNSLISWVRLVATTSLYFLPVLPLLSQSKSLEIQKNKQIGLESKIAEEDSDVTPIQIDVTNEVVSDFVWRGQSFVGDYLARRNNTPYTSFSQAYTYVPVARVSTPSGFYFEFEGNIALVGRSDKDSDQRIQSFPGAAAVDTNRWQNRFINGNYLPDTQGNSVFFDPSNNVSAEKCSLSSPSVGGVNLCAVDPTRVKNYSEKNGLARTDGLFTTFAYEIEAGKFGSFTVGTWWYFKKDRSAKNTWNEFFVWWELPWYRDLLNPTLQTFTQTSYDVGGGNGNQYTSFSLSHLFFPQKIVSLEWSTSVGYQWVNNNVSQKSGFSDVTTSLKFHWQRMFFSFNHAVRPDLYLYDNERIYFTNSVQGNNVTNISERDNRTVDPSKMFGVQNELVYANINQINEGDIVKTWLKDSYQSQMIPRHLFWLSIGINHSF